MLSLNKTALCSLLFYLAATLASADTATPQPKLTPQQVKAAVGEIDKLAHQTLKSTGVPGIAIIVVHQDQVIFKQGFGVREVGKPERIDANTVFQVASMSKPVASTVLAALVGKGKITWDDRVIDHDPGFRLYDPYPTQELRLRDLLCHRSGLPDHCGDLLEDIGFDRHEVARRLRFQPPASSFRTEYAYTNFGFSEAGYAAAKSQKITWEELADQLLFQPLGMSSTSYRFADYARASNRALLHVRVDGQWTAKHTRQPDAQAPAGGLSTTLNDLVPWMRLQLSEGKFEQRQLIPTSVLTETHTPQIVTNFNPAQGRVTSYGLGWIVSVERGGRVFLKHSGSFSLGMRSEVAMLPAEGLAIVVLSNGGPTGIPEGLVESFFDLAIDGKLQRDWMEFANRMFDEEIKKELGRERDYSHPPTRPSAALKLTAYTGKFANDFFGEIELAEKQGSLVLKMGPQQMTFPLRHWDRDTFVYQPQGESAGGPSGLLFTVAPDGQADRVLIENLNVDGQGVFLRVETMPQ
ncbi:MAG: serine hydrolase [Planctomycetes bacterium]|nr:serine hydrolase [Planctomycetota bacterium]